VPSTTNPTLAQLGRHLRCARLDNVTSKRWRCYLYFWLYKWFFCIYVFLL